MKISVLKSIIREKGTEVLELKKADVPLPDIIKYGICDIEVVMKKPIDEFFSGPSFYNLKREAGFPEFKLNIDGSVKNIRGIILTRSREDIVEFLSKYYVEGDIFIDSCIKTAPTKKEGIQKAFSSYFDNIEIVIFGFDEFIIDRFRSLKIERYRDFYVCFLDDDSENVVMVREKLIKVKNYKIPRAEYLIFFIRRKNELKGKKTIQRMFRDLVIINKKRIPESEFIKCLYYNGREFNFIDSISSKIVSNFEKNGYMRFVEPAIFGYNFLKFQAFIPWKKQVRRKITRKSLKNPFKVPVLFAFDSKIPINIPARANVIDDDEVIYAFNYIRNKKKTLPDFPIVYFHPSVKEDTEFLLIASV